MILGSRKNLKEIKTEISIFYRGETVQKKKIRIKKYPYWTIYNLDPSLELESILIHIKNLRVLGV